MRTNLVVLLVLVTVAIATSLLSLLDNAGGWTAEWRSGWLQNFSTEMMGAIVTYGLFELLVGTRKEKAKLLREAASPDNATANKAINELRAAGWIDSLRGLDLRQANLGGADLTYANLQRVNLQQASLKGANLHGASLLHAVISEKTRFDSTTILPDGQPWQADTDIKRFTHPDNKNFWRGFGLQGKNFSGQNWQQANLIGANLQYVNFSDANLTAAKLMGADLTGANLDDAYLGDAQLNHAQLTHADLLNCVMGGVILHHANLEHAFLEKAFLGNAYMTHVNLQGATLFGAVLRDANLAGSHLRNANLERCDLRRANLCGVDLTGANLLDAIWWDNQFDEHTIMPDGKPWTPETNIYQFNDRQTDFWRSDDPESPAFGALTE